MNTTGLAEGPLLIGGGALVIRFCRPLARSGIRMQTDKLDRSSFYDPDRIDEQKRSLTTPASYRLSAYMCVGAGVFLIVCGLIAFVIGLFAPG